MQRDWCASPLPLSRIKSGQGTVSPGTVPPPRLYSGPSPKGAGTLPRYILRKHSDYSVKARDKGTFPVCSEPGTPMNVAIVPINQCFPKGEIMKTINDYRKDCLTILGDPSGRRFSEDMLDMGLLEGLRLYRNYCPRKGLIQSRVTEVRDGSAVLPWLLDASVVVLGVRCGALGEELNAGSYQEPGRLVVTAPGKRFSVDEELMISVSLPQLIKGLDGARETTVPDSHALMLASGAAGYALRTRARSVTEVFGKRPEDREALSLQAEGLIADFLKGLERLALYESFQHDPYPRIKR